MAEHECSPTIQEVGSLQEAEKDSREGKRGRPGKRRLQGRPASESAQETLTNAAGELCRLPDENLVGSFALTKAGSQQGSSSENQ